jgi:ubiquinone/menaquinone biosynthesis C-methylase UbiE
MADGKKWDGERLETFVFNEATVEHLHRYALAMDLIKNKKVLDIACGEGYGSALLAGAALEVTGMDIDTPTIDKAKEKYRLTNVSFRTGQVENIPFEAGLFDTVVSFETIEHITDHQQMMQEIRRVLKPGGLLIISTPDKANYSDKTGIKNPFHAKELYRNEFIELLKQHFAHVDCYGQQIMHGSLLSSSADGFQQYHGDYTTSEKGSQGNELYHIALASAEPLPKIATSIFNGNSLMQKGLEEKEKMVMNTITYKVGHAILYPAKLIRSLFKK